jgi:integrase
MATPNASTLVFSSQDISRKTLSWIDEKDQQITPGMKFKDAGRLWIESRVMYLATGVRARGYIKKNTELSYRNELRALNLFFAETRLCDIRLDHFTRYQRLRIAGSEPFWGRRRPHEEPGPMPVQPQQVNQELGLLIRILKQVRIWTDEQNRMYEPLIEEIPEIQRALRPDEQQHWLAVARSSPRWNVVYWYSLLVFDTCMSTNEIRALRLGDINVQQRMITVPREGAKNAHRHRMIPIASDEAAWALDCLLQRARGMGSCLPQNYLFPLVKCKKAPSPDRHMTESGIKKLWEEVRQASKLTWFRQYDCRHTAITRLAEAGVPIPTIMKRAGHITPKMTDHYTHISDQMQVDSVRMAQRYNGGLGSSFGYSQPPMRGYVPSADPAALIGQLLQQCGMTAEQLRDALIAQTSQPPTPPSPPSNVIGFRTR